LPNYASLIKNIPHEVKQACERLKFTSIALMSIGLNKPDIPKHLWFYIYDEDVLASRCYSPSIKSPNNAPEDCSSFQFEIYFSKDKPLTLNNDELIEHILKKSEEMNVFNRDDVIVKDCRVLEYGNVIFYHGMEEDKNIVLEFLDENNIKTVGRFGKWEYLWSDQSLLTYKEIQ
jgi:protoporphyrinogen oxidase